MAQSESIENDRSPFSVSPEPSVCHVCIDGDLQCVEWYDGEYDHKFCANCLRAMLELLDAG